MINGGGITLTASASSLTVALGLLRKRKGCAGHRFPRADPPPAVSRTRRRRQVKKAKAEAKKATEAEVKSAKAAAAVQEFLGSEEHERRLVEDALKGTGYERGMEDALRPDVDAALLFVPLGGFQ